MDDGGRGTSRIGPIVAAAVLGAAVVAGVLLAGPAHVGTPPWMVPPPEATQLLHTPQPAPSQQPLEQNPHRNTFLVDVGPVLLTILVVAAVLVLAFLLWRMLRGRRRLGVPHTASLIAPGEFDPRPEDRDEADVAPAVARGIARALQLLDENREPQDAVVAAWLGLQESAADSGVRRRPSETPAEYTTRIIGRVGADREAAERLLHLYEDVRFGGHPVAGADVDTARDCLLRLRSTLEPTGRTGA